jgi:hypothetical protein
MTRKLASRETLERLAEAVDAYGRQNHMFEAEHVTPVREALRAYRAEITPPLRTRAEVDTEIALIVRAIVAATGESPGCWGIGKRTLGQESRLVTLCAEPTAPEGETPEPAREYCGPCYVNGVRQTPGHPGSCAAWKEQLR